MRCWPAEQTDQPRCQGNLSSVLDLLPVGEWIADRQAMITPSNEAACKIWCGVHRLVPQNYGVYQGLAR